MPRSSTLNTGSVISLFKQLYLNLIMFRRSSRSLLLTLRSSCCGKNNMNSKFVEHFMMAPKSLILYYLLLLLLLNVQILSVVRMKILSALKSHVLECLSNLTAIMTSSSSLTNYLVIYSVTSASVDSTISICVLIYFSYNIDQLKLNCLPL